MKTDNNKISTRQSTILVILYFFCSSIVTMPVFCISGTGQAGYISAVLSVLFMLIPLFLVFFVLKDDKSASFYELCEKTVGKWITNLICGLFVLKIILLSFLILKLFSETLKIFLLPKTPVFVTALVMLLLCAYLASKGMETRARLGEIVVFLIGIPFFAVFIAACFSIDINNISESFSVPMNDIFTNSFLTYLAFGSFDFLILHFHYCAERKKALKRMFWGSIFTVLTTAGAIFITTACFGTYIMSKQAAPIPEIMNVIKLPATLIERHDLLNMFFWIILLFWFLSTSVFWGCIGLKDMFKKPTHTFCIIIMLPIIYVFSFIKFDISLIYGLIGLLNIASNIAFYITVLGIFIVKKIKGTVKQNG